ncbi:hypothetical protein JHE00_34710, partial [Prauserella sp. ASG 168]|nr:hypothetical protein [Prauserella cavernicola]
MEQRGSPATAPGAARSRRWTRWVPWAVALLTTGAVVATAPAANSGAGS